MHTISSALYTDRRFSRRVTSTQHRCILSIFPFAFVLPPYILFDKASFNMAQTRQMVKKATEGKAPRSQGE
jgi:hypothetical protein